jgi:hypothetical protein
MSAPESARIVSLPVTSRRDEATIARVDPAASAPTCCHFVSSV